MQEFSRLLDALGLTQSRNRKIALLAQYYQSVPDPDRGWALAALTDNLPLRLPLRRLITELMDDKIDPELYRLSRDYVGDTAETVALLWPNNKTTNSPPTLGHLVEHFQSADRGDYANILREALDALDSTGRWALLKLIGGAPRVGVSARLAKIALASAFAHDISDIEEVWHAVDPPYGALFDWLEGRSARPDPGQRPVFRPLMLAHPIEDVDWQYLNPNDISAEWKWDGIRVQVAAKNDQVRLFSRTGDDISKSFPEIGLAFLGHNIVADGELLIMRDGAVAPFNDLQQRLNRKTVTKKMLEGYPAHIRFYDLLYDGDDDIRSQPFHTRRKRLEDWHAHNAPYHSDVSTLVAFSDFENLHKIWAGTRSDGIEGLMLKNKNSPYLSGRPKGHWWKWKRAPLTLDCVLMYAQRGSGKRSSFYSDYTFGVWTDADDGTPALVPVGKAYSGFTDEELKRLDQFVRQNTTDRFGPVRAVKPELVFEVAFDAVQVSKRHKSGIAMRFPRIHRIRWDKPANEADTLETTKKLLPENSARENQASRKHELSLEQQRLNDKIARSNKPNI